MNKNLTKLIVLCCMFAVGLSNNAIAQCTQIAAPTAVYDVLSAPPCDAACGTATVAPYEVWGNEAYTVNVTAGSQYVFEFCTGYLAATWPATITVAEGSDASAPGTVLGTVDGCSLTFTTPNSGSVIVYVTVTGDCGGLSNQVDNGLGTINCGPNGATCPLDGPCDAGVMTSTAQSVCPAESFDITLGGTVVSDGGFMINYSNVGTNGTGGIEAPVDITGYTAVDFPYSGDSDLGGILSSNSLPPFAGTWNAKVYALDFVGAICDSTATVAITFLDGTDAQCTTGPCDAGVMTSASSQDVCGTDGTFDLTTDGSEVTTGGFELGFSDANGGTGGLTGGFALTNATLPVTYDSDLNGVMSSNSLDPLVGQWDITLYALNGAGLICDSTSVTSIYFLDSSDPACTPVACPVPFGPSVEMTTTTTASFSWISVPGATFYQVRYRVKGTTAWAVVGSGSSPRAVSGLQTKRNYQYKIRAQCADGSWSPYTGVTNFYTSQCAPPTGVATTFTDLTRMRVRWDNNPDEIKAKIRYRVQGTPDWITQNSADGNNFLWVNGLPSGATVQYKVRSNCDGNDWSEYSSPLNTIVLGTTSRESQVISETTLSPNPANEVLNLSFNTADASEVTIRISDNLGKEVLSMNNTYSAGTQRETLDISRLVSGYYFVTIYSNDNVETLKFVKNK
jgi:hypothetical protein